MSCMTLVIQGVWQKLVSSPYWVLLCLSYSIHGQTLISLQWQLTNPSTLIHLHTTLVQATSHLWNSPKISLRSIHIAPINTGWVIFTKLKMTRSPSMASHCSKDKDNFWTWPTKLRKIWPILTSSFSTHPNEPSLSVLQPHWPSYLRAFTQALPFF